jgi:cell division protein FtsB
MYGYDMKIKKIGRWIAVALCLGVLSFIFAGKDSIVNLYLSHRNITKKEQEIKALHAEIDTLTLEIRKLRGDTIYIEKIAREKLGMAGKNEKVYKFVEEK